MSKFEIDFEDNKEKQDFAAEFLAMYADEETRNNGSLTLNQKLSVAFDNFIVSIIGARQERESLGQAADQVRIALEAKRAAKRALRQQQQ